MTDYTDLVRELRALGWEGSLTRQAADAIEQLRAVIATYANHHNFCPALGDEGMEVEPTWCTCGFRAAMANLT